ncbi:competence protein CoiA family protein [Labrenzia sp. DG1229]|uniref:competence protein CoiA n=1 Tax=Labrenzia sp. DG1229 TaxID=681847 RepID=UPI00068F3628|nr:competence protein CoiA family protein [Labrenzia sp. DG1229]
MRFALHNDLRIEATPRANGTCPGCGAELIARCGTKKVWHWAHKGQRHCDHWWENETQWHRDWKNNFPAEWQEIAARDEHGELHIADIKTPKGLVVEFQHSYIKPEEARTRTKFHQPMFWIVDGMRRKTDYKQFMNAQSDGVKHPTKDGLVQQLWVYDSRLLKEWIHVGVIVAFDFGEETVWVLRRIKNDWVYGFEYPKPKLVEHISESTAIPDVLFGKPKPPARRAVRYRRRRARF